MRNDLTLRPVIARHLPELESYRAYLAGYGDEALALKFFDYFRDGQRKFRSVRTQEDYQALRDFSDIFERLRAKYYELSRENMGRLEASYREISEEQDSDRRRLDSSKTTARLTKLDYALFWNGFGFDREDLPEDSMEIPDVDSFHSDFRHLLETTSWAFEIIDDFDIYKRVNWSVCAVTFLAQMAWQKRTGKEAPQSAHADAPGPFGLFLEDVLAELFEIYEMPAKDVPSARSALRALENITSSRIKFRGNW